MKKNHLLISFAILGFLLLSSCKKDDNGVIVVPPRDRGEEMIESTIEIETYLETHFYNYEEFDNPPANFDYRIKFDTIAGDNSTKTPLMDQVAFKNVPDRLETDVIYKLYYLVARQGQGESPNFPDLTSISYEGTYINNDDDGMNVSGLFDSSLVPVQFDLTLVVNGLQDALIEFNASTGFVENPDGSVTFEEYGVGAVFMQTGLAYFVSPPGGSGIPFYSQLVFSFQLFQTEQGDQDGDTIPSILEDINGNGLEEDDDSDGDFLPNYGDVDDDGDLRLTRNEVTLNTYILNPGDPDPILASNEVETAREIDEMTGITTITTITFTDLDNNGIPDYLDPNN